jgi:cyclopropane fatty-acyl-phospholipid synthase-like methyltransferase
MFGNKIIDMMCGPWVGNTLICASKLKIFNHLHQGPLTLEQITAKTGARIKYLEVLLDACASVGLLIKMENKYQNSDISSLYLVEESPTYMGDMIEVLFLENKKWENLYHLLTSRPTSTTPGSQISRTPNEANKAQKGQKAQKANKEQHQEQEESSEVDPHIFTMAMNNFAQLGEADALAKAINLSQARILIDAGCGSGMYSVVLCRQYPNLRAILLDFKTTLNTTRKIITKAELQDRIQLKAMDISQSTNSYSDDMSADVVLLSDVLYQEKNNCMTILQSAFNALKPKGTLIIRGYYLNNTSVFAPFFNLHQLLGNPDRESISVTLISQWIQEAGFEIERTFPLTERSHCLISKRP